MDEPVDVRYEISAYLSELDSGPAVRFRHVRDHAMDVVGNVLNSRERLARGLGVSVSLLRETIDKALGEPGQTRVVDGGPCQEVVVTYPALDVELPAPWFFERETGPYVTAGAIVARDVVTGAGNLSIARIKLLGGNRGLVGIAPNHHLAILADTAEKQGRSLPVAVCVGVAPAVLVAACVYAGLGDDEMGYAAALLGGSLDVVEAGPTGLHVPATAEVVIEGVLEAGKRLEEGVVSEFHGMYEDYGAGRVLTASRLTRRRDALFQVIEPGFHREHILLGAVAIEAGLLRALRRVVPAVRRVHVTDAGAGRTEAVISVGGARPGTARRVMFAAWAAVTLVKRVVVVDEDVDVDDGVAVGRAIASRVVPERDVVLVQGGPGDRAEPLENEGTVSRYGVDATRHPGDRDWEEAGVPAEMASAVRERILRQGSRLLQPEGRQGS